jgi:hypothetical protein
MDRTCVYLTMRDISRQLPSHASTFLTSSVASTTAAIRHYQTQYFSTTTVDVLASELQLFVCIWRTLTLDNSAEHTYILDIMVN